MKRHKHKYILPLDIYTNAGHIAHNNKAKDIYIYIFRLDPIGLEAGVAVAVGGNEMGWNELKQTNTHTMLILLLGQVLFVKQFLCYKQERRKREEKER